LGFGQVVADEQPVFRVLFLLKALNPTYVYFPLAERRATKCNPQYRVARHYEESSSLKARRRGAVKYLAMTA
jgi:hypothetical protein